MKTILYRMLRIIVYVLALLHYASPEVWVAVETRIERTGEAVEVPGSRYLSGLHAYPSPRPGHAPSFLATDVGKQGAGLYRVEGGVVSLIYQDSSSSYFESVVFSPLTGNIYLTSPSSKSIIRLDSEGKATTIFSSNHTKPSGLTLDTCTGLVYWSDTARENASIQVFRDESQQPDTVTTRPLIVGNLTRPRAITVDSTEGLLYWTDQVRHEYTIWRSSLSGSGRELVCRGRGSEPFSLAVTGDFLYWSDWASHTLWRVEKGGDCSAELVSKFKGARPNGISYYPETEVNCQEREIGGKNPGATKEDDIGQQEHVIHFPTTERGTDQEYPTQILPNITSCGSECVHGVCENGGCVCEEGWEGPGCESDLCHNYCLAGTCLLLEGHPLCFCQEGVEGDRCERKVEMFLLHISRQTLEIVCLSLSTIAITLFSIVVLLSALLTRSRRKPRIVRKRFISVSRPVKGKSAGLPTEDGIQLDIEDCCNMTLCDTPCFDPPTRTPREERKSIVKSTSGPASCHRASKSSDKRSLLAGQDNDDDLLF